MGCLPGFETAPKSRSSTRWTVCRTEYPKAGSSSFRRRMKSRHSWSQPSVSFGAGRYEPPISSIADKTSTARRKQFPSTTFDNHRSLVLSFVIPEGTMKKTPHSNENRSSTLFIQPDPVRLQARILRPTEVGCKLPAMGNAELSRMNRALTRQCPRAPPEVHGTGAIPLCGSKPPSNSVGIHEERRELNCESMVVFRFGSPIKPPRGTTRKKSARKTDRSRENNPSNER